MQLRSGIFNVFAVLATLAIISVANARQLNPDVDETWKVPLQYVGSGNELELRQGTMCTAAGYTQLRWNRTADVLEVDFVYYGLPNLGRVCFSHNPNTPYNQWPPCVEADGEWQILLVYNIYEIPVTHFYDPVTQILLGSDYDHYGNTIPANAIAVPTGASHMIPSRKFKPDHEGNVKETFQFRYSDIRDEDGTTGTLLTLASKNLSNPFGTFINLYTNEAELLKPVPTSNWANVVADLNTKTDPTNPGVVSIVLTYTPKHKPAYLKGRDMIMLGQSGVLTLAPLPPGDDTATCAAKVYGLNPDCGTFQLNNFFPFLNGC